MKSKNQLGFILMFTFLSCFSQEKPNILWIITDDHRADALEIYNKITTGKNESELGYVSSPNINKLAEEGALFVNAYCNSPACGPSRGSMLSGRYPFKNGHYSFDPTHQEPDFVRPSFPQTLQKEGYVTTSFGKDGCYIFKWGPGQGFKNAGHYNYKVSFKHDLQKNDIGDLWNQPVYKKGTWESLGTEERVKLPDGTIQNYFINRKGGKLNKDDLAKKKEIEDKYEILRAYTRTQKDLIIGGENPQPKGKTIDGKIVEEFKLYLDNQNKEFKNTWGLTRKGANNKLPLMVNLGFHLPHTPVLPPKSFRDKFKKKSYKIPEFDLSEIDQLPDQMVNLFKKLNMSNMSKKDKIQAIQDYYAFCAYADYLIGDAVKAFKNYCTKNNQEYLILLTVGDHGWHLGEQGIEAKFGPWNKSTKGAMIAVSSDKNKIPNAVVQNQLVEYVDIAPTILSASGMNVKEKKFEYLDGFNLLNLIGTKKENRDYILGEMNLVVGPRAYLRSNEFAFSMRTRPQVRKLAPNENIKWALNCPIEKADLALYDLRKDPKERNNVANDRKYKKLTAWFRNKLGNIVLGDGRIECDWSQANSYNISSFAKGAHDRKLNIPDRIVPTLK
jgi:arylsulfatase A-like enzyme